MSKPKPTKQSAALGFEFPPPRLLHRLDGAVLVAWDPPVPKDAQRLAQNSGAPQRHTQRLYLVEFKAASASHVTIVETHQRFCVVPFDFVGEALLLRVNFRFVGPDDTLHVGHRVSIPLLDPAPHPLLRPAGEDRFGALVPDPLLLCAFAAATSPEADPTGALGAMAPALPLLDAPTAAAALAPRPHGCATYNGVQLFVSEFDVPPQWEAVASTGVQLPLCETAAASVSPSGTAAAVEQAVPLAPLQRGSLRKCVLISTSPAVMEATRHNNRDTGLGVDFNLERCLAEHWLPDPTVLVLFTGFGVHGAYAAQTAHQALRAAQRLTKHSFFIASPCPAEALARVQCVSFCSPPERFFDGATDMCATAPFLHHFLYVLPQCDTVRPALAVTSAAATAASGRHVPDGLAGQSAAQAFKERANVPKHSDTALGVLAGFVCNERDGSCGVAMWRDGETHSLEAVPGSHTVEDIRLQLVAAANATGLHDAATLLQPSLRAVRARMGRVSHYRLTVEGSFLHAPRCLVLFSLDAPGEDFEVAVRRDKGSASELHGWVHPAVLLRFAGHDGVAHFAVMCVTEYGATNVLEASVCLSDSLRPFVGRVGGFATAAPLDLLRRLIRMQALLLRPGDERDRPVKVLKAFDVAAVVAGEVARKRKDATGFFSRVARAVSSDPLTEKGTVRVPKVIKGAVEELLQEHMPLRLTMQPEALVQRFAKTLAGWGAGLRQLAPEAYPLTVVRVCDLLQIPLSASVREETDPTAVAMLEALVYHEVAATFSACGSPFPPSALLTDFVSPSAFFEYYTRVFLQTDKYARAKETDAVTLFEEVLGLWIVCAVHAARFVTGFTTLVATTGLPGSGVTTVAQLRATAGPAPGPSLPPHTAVVYRELPPNPVFAEVAVNGTFERAVLAVVAEPSDVGGPACRSILRQAAPHCADAAPERRVVVTLSKMDQQLGAEGSAEEVAARLVAEAVPQTAQETVSFAALSAAPREPCRLPLSDLRDHAMAVVASMGAPL